MLIMFREFWLYVYSLYLYKKIIPIFSFFLITLNSMAALFQVSPFL